MSKRRRIVLFVLGGLLLVAAAGLFILYRASQHVPEFYRRALEVDKAAQAEAADRMERLTFEMSGDLQRPRHWQMVFTADEINGWLAVELPKKFPALLPPAMQDPRVAISPQGIVLACRYQQDRLQSVLSLAIVPYVPQSDVLALRIGQPRAGLLPLPMDKVLSGVSQAVKETDLDVQWQQAGGDPVLRITLPSIPGKHRKRVRIESLQLRDGELCVEGTTEREP